MQIKVETAASIALPPFNKVSRPISEHQVLSAATADFVYCPNKEFDGLGHPFNTLDSDMR